MAAVEESVEALRATIEQQSQQLEVRSAIAARRACAAYAQAAQLLQRFASGSGVCVLLSQRSARRSGSRSV